MPNVDRTQYKRNQDNINRNPSSTTLSNSDLKYLLTLHIGIASLHFKNYLLGEKKQERCVNLYK